MQHVNQQGTTRRTMLRAGAAAGTAAALGAAGIFAAGTASAATMADSGNQRLPYPSGVTDTSHCTPEVAGISAASSPPKASTTPPRSCPTSPGRTPLTWTRAWASACQAGRWRTTSSPRFRERACRRDRLSAAHRRRRAKRRNRVRGHPRVLRPGDTRPLLRRLRQQPQDHPLDRLLDGRSSLTQNTIASTYPTDFRDSEQNADPAAVQAAQALQAAFAAGDAAAAVALMSYDVVHEDVAAHTRVRGPLQAQRYYTRRSDSSRTARAPLWSTPRAAARVAATSGRRPRTPPRCAAATPASSSTKPSRSAA